MTENDNRIGSGIPSYLILQSSTYTSWQVKLIYSFVPPLQLHSYDELPVAIFLIWISFLSMLFFLTEITYLSYLWQQKLAIQIDKWNDLHFFIFMCSRVHFVYNRQSTAASTHPVFFSVQSNIYKSLLKNSGVLHFEMMRCRPRSYFAPTTRCLH